MKKIIILSILFVFTQVTIGQNIDKIFSKFSKQKGAEFVDIKSIDNLDNVDQTTLTGQEISAIVIKHTFQTTMGVGIEKLQVLNLDECSESVKSKFAKEIIKIKDDTYQTLVKTIDEDISVRILRKLTDEKNGELVIITSGDSNNIVSITGNLKGFDITKVMGNN